MIFPREHPYHEVLRLAQSARHVRALEFGVYRYEPQSVTDRRRIEEVAVGNIPARVQQLVSELEPDEELALHSRVHLSPGFGPSVHHLPLIDFAGNEYSSCASCVAEAVVDFGVKKALLYSSGRSYHLYGLTLLDQQSWTRFMGRLLLLNLPHQPECVDSRWIGHRLMAGYGSLRWTRNTAHYLSVPSVLSSPVLYSAGAVQRRF